jgi:hypothetical protein
MCRAKKDYPKGGKYASVGEESSARNWAHKRNYDKEIQEAIKKGVHHGMLYGRW